MTRIHTPRIALGDLPLGASGVVGGITGDRGVTRRLMELGLLPGTPISIVRRAPLGDPIELHLRGFSLSIRRNEALGVAMERVDLPVASPSVAPEAVI